MYFPSSLMTLLKPHGRSREQTLTNCPLTFTYVYMCIHTHRASGRGVTAFKKCLESLIGFLFSHLGWKCQRIGRFLYFSGTSATQQEVYSRLSTGAIYIRGVTVESQGTEELSTLNRKVSPFYDIILAPTMSQVLSCKCDSSCSYLGKLENTHRNTQSAEEQARGASGSLRLIS